MIEQIHYKGFDINIYPDEDPTDPREMCDYLWTMVCSHSRYRLGDVQVEWWHDWIFDHLNNKFSWLEKYFDEIGNAENIDAIQKRIDKNLVMLPLYLYDHSWITMSTGAFSCRRDSWQVGIIYIHRDDLKEHFKVKRLTKKHIDKAKEILEAEVEEYDKYLTWQIYWYRIDWLDESCRWFDDQEDMIDQAKGAIDCHLDRLLKAHIKKRKAQIKHRVPLQYRLAFG